jgi:hypothetical protein
MPWVKNKQTGEVLWLEPWQVAAMSVDNSDRLAASRMHSALPTSAKVAVQGAVEVKTGAAHSRGWIEPVPLKPPSGLALIDAMVEADTTRKRIEALQAEIARLRALDGLAEATTEPKETAASAARSTGSATGVVERGGAEGNREKNSRSEEA